METPEQTKAVEPVRAGALARPAFMAPGENLGKEAIDKSDLKMPRLTLAQGLSPQLQPTEPQFIEGLAFGDAFNSLTGRIYGKKPLRVVVVRAEKARYIEFIPKQLGGGIKDFNVPANDPRAQFFTDKDGVRQKPLATKFLEFIALLLGEDGPEPIALSFKSTGLDTAKTLNTLMTMATNENTFDRVYELIPTQTKNNLGTWAIFGVRLVGMLEDEATYRMAQQLYASVKDRELAPDETVITPDTDEREDVPF